MRFKFLVTLAAAIFALTNAGLAQAPSQGFDLPEGGGRPHDVAADATGIVWYTAQYDGKLGRIDPKTGAITLIPLGEGARPHGVIIGPDGAPWLTDAARNAILRVDPQTNAVKTWTLPKTAANANLNTAAFDGRGRIWFTGQSGIYGVLDPGTGEMNVYAAPKGVGPYGIAATPKGDIYYASLAGNYLGQVDMETGQATVIEPPRPDQGARRVWSDSKGRLYVTEWNTGYLSRYDPAAKTWKSWRAPAEDPHLYAVYVDETDKVWVSEWDSNSVMRFDPVTEKFQVFPNDREDANVRQINGRKGEVWVPYSAASRIVSYKTK